MGGGGAIFLDDLTVSSLCFVLFPSIIHWPYFTVLLFLLHCVTLSNAILPLSEERLFS